MVALVNPLDVKRSHSHHRIMQSFFNLMEQIHPGDMTPVLLVKLKHQLKYVEFKSYHEEKLGSKNPTIIKLGSSRGFKMQCVKCRGQSAV